MNIKITKSIDGGSVRAIASKSQAHRLLICAALSDKESHVVCPQRSADIDATVRCLSALGAIIRHTDKGFFVRPITSLGIEGRRTLDCGESGSTLRFLLPVSGALGAYSAFQMSGRLPSRPLSPLYEELLTHGCVLSDPGKNPLYCYGQLEPGDFTVAGNISSQFISGLLFALPLVNGDSTVTITGQVESGPYIDMTVSALRQFGIAIRKEAQRYFIQGNQTYRSPGTVNVEGDWSNAAFWLCAGAVGGRSVTCTNLNMDSLQGDKAVVRLLERFGAHVEASADSVTVSPGKLTGIELDAGDIPDLVPVLASVASVADGRTVIYNAERLRIKESDRLHSVTETLTSLGADISETETGLVINGKPELNGGEVFSFGDHRIAMTAAVISAACKNPVLIQKVEAISKSYPGFFRDFAALGGTSEEY
jgi:3-phosphoshikimate 1-carboxyvinyltransferase